MKKMLLALSLLALHHFSYGQTMYSEFNQYTWDGIFPGGSGPSGPKCPSFSVMCVDVFGACPSPYQQWHRIGSPDQLTTSTGGTPTPNPSDIHLFSVDNQGEGLFTSFSFMPSKTYKITVGVKYANILGGSSSTTGFAGMLVLGAADNLVETPTGTSPCAQSHLFNQSGSTWTLNSTNNTNASTTGDVIGTITPAYANPGGPTLDYIVLYSPTTLHNEFSIQYYNDHPMGNQQDISLDYIKIEEVCNYNSNFTYEYSTLNPVDVDFYPATWGAPAPYDWHYGDGSTSTSSTNHSHTYPALGNYIASLAIEDCHREVAKLCLNEPVVYNYIPEGHTVNTPQAPCNPHFRVMGNSEHQNEIAVTVLGSHTGTNAFKVVWGDGSTSTSPVPQSFIHTYSSTGSYTVCVKADSERCSTCIDICVERLLTTDGDGEHGGGGVGVGQGKSGITSIKNAETLEVISINPNPANAMVNINLESPSNSKVEINVFDITGKRVINTENMLSQGKNKIELDVKMLAAGTYIIEMKSGNNEILRAKMTKE